MASSRDMRRRMTLPAARAALTATVSAGLIMIGMVKDRVWTAPGCREAA
jgi:hypothetical protein